MMNQNELSRHTLETPAGAIAYWVTPEPDSSRPWLVFLPGLTADHRLFESQIEFFATRANILAWDPPSHGESRPFDLSWTLDDLVRWLHEIFEQESVSHPVFIGQSMGGYTAQAFMELFPGEASGFVSIDSCPLKREYYKNWELAALRHTKLMFLSFPWETLVRLGANNNATTERGRAVMEEMMRSFDKREYCELSAHGFRILADAVAKDRPYDIDCPCLLICGTEDHAGSAQRYNREWERRTGNPVHWIEGAGHNSNSDDPATVNAAIEAFLATL